MMFWKMKLHRFSQDHALCGVLEGKSSYAIDYDDYDPFFFFSFLLHYALNIY